MAYINRELALELLKRNSITEHITFSDGVSIYDTIANIPTADFVPKSEVAMEIFAEIEKAINNLEYQTNYKRKTVPIQTMTDVVNWVLHEVVPETIAKLKKKYTEDQT